MAKCGCAGSSCGCLVIGGAGITVTGVGSAANPYLITAHTADIGDQFFVTDSPTINFTLLGSGTIADPFNLTAAAVLNLTQLADVGDPGGPVAGDVPTWVGGGGGHWEFMPGGGGGGGTVDVGPGLTGDGSGADPLEVNVPGTWGANRLADWGADSTYGDPIYADTNGQLRAAPTFIRCTSTTRPAVAYAGMRIHETDTGLNYIGDGTSWDPIVTAVQQNIYAVVARTTIGGAVSIVSATVNAPKVLRYTLSSNTTLTLADGVAGQAYMVYLDVVTQGFTLAISGTATFAGLETTARGLVPLFWAGDTWFSQWRAA